MTSVHPVCLKGIAAIARAFGKRRATIRAWREMGAPIFPCGGESNAAHVADYHSLLAWVGENFRRRPASCFPGESAPNPEVKERQTRK